MSRRTQPPHETPLISLHCDGLAMSSGFSVKSAVIRQRSDGTCTARLVMTGDGAHEVLPGRQLSLSSQGIALFDGVVGSLTLALAAEGFAFEAACQGTSTKAATPRSIQLQACSGLIECRVSLSDALAGQLRCSGLQPVQPGDKVEIVGAPAGFSEALDVTGVTHALSEGRWTTGIDVGVSAPESILDEVHLADRHGNRILLNAAGIQLDSKAAIVLNGLNIDCRAQVGFTAKGAATAELSASGQTTIKGAMVMIN